MHVLRPHKFVVRLAELYMATIEILITELFREKKSRIFQSHFHFEKKKKFFLKQLEKKSSCKKRWSYQNEEKMLYFDTSYIIHMNYVFLQTKRSKCKLVI